MKSFLQRCFLLFLAVNAYSQDKPLHVYIEDAETGAAIVDAVVEIEGFGLLPIAGKFNEDSANYFFESVPEGYNTVMAYHDKYTEKGFRAETLPDTVKLKLYEPNFVSYDFEKPHLWDIHQNYSDKLPKYQRNLIDELDEKHKSYQKLYRPTFRFFYEEDPYHIAIISKLPSDKFFGNDSIKTMLRELSLVHTESMTDEKSFQCFGIKSIYTLYEGYVYRGLGSIQDGKRSCYCDKIDFDSSHRVYFFHKKDKSKFSRFNSPEIKSLRDAGMVVASIAYRKLEYYGKKKFNRRRFYNVNNSWYLNPQTEAVVNNYFLTSFYNKPLQTLFSSAAADGKARYISGVGALPSDDEDVIYNLYFVFPTDDNKAIGLGALDIATEADYEKAIFFSNTYKE